MKTPTTPGTEPAHDILRCRQQPLDVFFAPGRVAVIGATETPGSVGRTLLWNLISNPFGGTVFPVNLRRPSVLGIKAYPHIAAVPEPVDLAALEELMVRFSQLVVEQRWIREIDINPLLASPDRLVALDARVVLHGPAVGDDQFPALAIRPYPPQYVTPWTLKDGTPVTIRPIRPEDEPMMVRFHEALSERSVYLRYFHTKQLGRRVAHERLTRMCFIDYDREMALVADHKDPETGRHDILAIGRLIRLRGTNAAEVALLVGDRFQGRGLGTELLRRLLQVARDEKVARIAAVMLPENRTMHRICEKLGFRLQLVPEEQVMKAELDL